MLEPAREQDSGASAAVGRHRERGTAAGKLDDFIYRIKACGCEISLLYDYSRRLVVFMLAGQH